ncbi:MAG: hypothetical protein ACLFNQ_12320 [Spirochaetaceae bacterium]
MSTEPPTTNPEGSEEQLHAVAGLTDLEQEEIQTHIDSIAGENRIPVASEAFQLRSAPRGLVLPLLVSLATMALVAASLTSMHRLYMRDEQTIRQRAGEFVSVEGRLIRALREETREQLTAKQQEISSIRSRLSQLEAEQAAIEADFEQRIAIREAEIREELEREIEAERARLIAEGLGNEEIDRLMEQFERERQAFYEQQLQEYRERLEEERLALQTNIDELRAEFQSQIEQLELERNALRQAFVRRERELQAELQQRTLRASIEPSEANENAVAAVEELADLSTRAEQDQLFERQVNGQLSLVQELVAGAEWDRARSAIEETRVLLSEPDFSQIMAATARRESALFLLQQLELVIDQQEALERESPLPEAPETTSDTIQPPSNEDTAELLDQVAFFREAAAVAESRFRDLSVESEIIIDELTSQIADLSQYQQQVSEAQRRYRAFLESVRNSRGDNSDQASLVARQELDDLLRSPEFVTLFEELSDEVTVLFSAVQAAGSDAALAEAATVVTQIMTEPSVTGRLNRLQFERDDAAGNQELLMILDALERAITEEN